MKTNFEVRQAKNEYDDDISLPVVYYLNAWHYTQSVLSSFQYMQSLYIQKWIYFNTCIQIFAFFTY